MKNPSFSSGGDDAYCLWASYRKRPEVAYVNITAKEAKKIMDSEEHQPMRRRL